MLLGLSFIIFGSAILVDQSSELGGIEFILMLFGLGLTMYGFLTKD
ncbi:MAG: hypothetical protein ACYDG6_00560 [Thermincolia bacterium]